MLVHGRSHPRSMVGSVLETTVGCAHMGTLTLPSDEAEVLDGSSAGGSEPVRGSDVELCCLARLEEQVLVAEHEA